MAQPQHGVSEHPTRTFETDRLHSRFPNVAACLLLLVLVLGFFWKLVFTRQFTFLEAPDVANQVLPWLEVQAAALRQGQIALWDPYIFGGQSLIGQVQPAVASPLTYLLLITPLQDGHLRTDFIHYWFVFIHYLATAFAYWLLKDLGCTRTASVIGGLFFAIAGFVGNTTWPQHLICAIWIPLIFLFLLRSLRGMRPLGNAALAGLFLGISLLSGHHQVPVFISMALAGVLVAAAITHREEWLRVASRAGVLFGSALLIAAVQILPALEYARYAMRWVNVADPVGWRDRVPYIAHQNLALRPADLLFLLLPGGGSGISNPIAGLAALSLAAIAITMSFEQLRTRLFALIAVAALLFSMARNNVLHGMAYALMPFLEKARAPIMALSMVHFAIAALVAFGVGRFLERTDLNGLRRIARWLLWTGAVVLALAFVPAPFVSQINDGANRFAMVGVLALLLAGIYWLRARGHLAPQPAAVLVALVLVMELGNSTGFDYVHREEPKNLVLPRLMGGTKDIAEFLKRQPDPKRVEFRYDDMLFNFGDWHQIETMSGFVPSAPEATYRLGWWNPAVLRLYGVSYSIGKKPLREGQPELFAGAGGMKVFANANPFPRAWTVHATELRNDPAEIARLIAEDKVDLRTRAIVRESLPALETCPEPDQVTSVREELQSVDISVNMACRGLLVVADNADPGWTAMVDGASVPIHTVDVAIRGIVVEAGRHRITMRYEPPSVKWGLALTLLGIVAVIALAVRPERPRPAVLEI